MNEFSVMAKDFTEVAKDTRDDVKELGDKKIYGDVTGKDIAQTGGKVVVGYVAGGPFGAGVALAREFGEPVVKNLAEKAGVSKETAEDLGKGTKFVANMASAAIASENLAEGIFDGIDAIGRISEATPEVVNFDVPVAQAGELSDAGKNLIASDITNDVSELDLPVATNAEKINETVIGGKFEFNEGAVSEGVANIETNLIKLDTRNQALEGTAHPETGVPFERKVIDIGNYTKVEGVFPKFDSVIDIQLPEDMLKAPDSVQFPECNRQLKEAFEANPDKFSFDKEQMEQILDGETPDGYTWHHDAEVGKMQLVESDIHAKTGHTGGRVVWGGGNENR